MTVPDSRRVVTVRQPWADLIMAGVKTVENRTRPVPSTLPQWGRNPQDGTRVMPGGWGPGRHDAVFGGYEPDGPFPFLLWIHAAAHRARDTSPGIAEAWCSLAEAWSLDPAAYGYRIGALAMQRVHDEGRYDAVLGSVTVVGQHHARECVHEFSPDFTRWAEWRWCSRWAAPLSWHIQVTDPQPLDRPIPMRGRQGWWRLPGDLEVAS